MWHQEPGATNDGGGGWTRKRRALLFVLVGFVALYALVNWQANRNESNREKRICELAAGAGNCVRSGGEWVPRGYSPLFGP